MSLEDIFEKLSSSQKGLPSAEAKERLQKYGYNEIQEKKVNPFKKFLGYFWSPIPWMIEAAAIISAVINHWEDFWIIIGLLLLNAIVAFWQEHKADNAINLLKQRLAAKAYVLRDGMWTEPGARELVPGDVVRIRLGDIVPADVKLFDGDYLLIDHLL
jgi:H+-transporting ATPase